MNPPLQGEEREIPITAEIEKIMGEYAEALENCTDIGSVVAKMYFLLLEAERRGAKKMAEAVKGDQSPINNAGDPKTLRYEQIWTMRVDKALDQTLTRIMDNPHNKE